MSKNRTWILVALAAAALGNAALAAPAGVVQSTPDRAAVERVLSSQKFKPTLSGSDCTALGGQVLPSSVCLSGSYCQTYDEKGVGHEVCLSPSHK